MREKLETMVELIDAIEFYKKRIRNAKRAEYYVIFGTEHMREHSIDIYNRCIERLKMRYNKLKTEL